MSRLLTWTIALVVACGWLFSGGSDRLRSDLSLFLPGGHNLEQQLLLDQLREGPASRLILLGIEGGDGAGRSRVSRLLSQQLSANGLFTQINNGDHSLQPDRWLTLFAYRYLLSPRVNREHFSADSLRAALEMRLQELASPLSALHARLLPADPTGELLALEQLLRPQQVPASSNGVWSSGDGSRAILVAETRASGFDLDAQQQAVAAIEAAFTAAAPTDQGYRILVSGPGVYAAMSRQVIRTESTLLSLLAGLCVAAIVFFGYRSLPLVFYSALPVVSGLLAGSCAVLLWFGAIHGITLAFGITLLGMTIDYPIHLFSHLAPNEPARVGLARIWPTLRLSALTSAAAFGVMLTTDFDGLVQLGLFAVAGLVAALLTTYWAVPGLPALNREFVSSGYNSTPKEGATTLLPGRRMRTAVTVTLCAVALLWIWQQRHLLWEDDLAALSPVPASLIEQDRELRHQLGAPEVSRLLLLQGDSQEELLQQAEALQSRLEELAKRGEITAAELVSRYLPSSQTQRQRQSELPDGQTLRANLEQAMRGLPFRQGSFKPFLADVAAARALPPLTMQMLQGTPLQSRVEGLLRRVGEKWLLMIPLSGVQGGEISVEKARYIDLRAETSRFVGGFRDEALDRLGWGLLVLVLLLLAALRSPQQVLRVLLPVASALVIDVALLLALGQRLSLFHLVSLLLVAGISLDYSLFVNRPGADRDGFRRTRHALTVCLASTAAVFGLLALSELPVLRAIGMTVVIGVTSGYIVAFAYAENSRESQ